MDLEVFRETVRGWLAGKAARFRADAASGDSRAFRRALSDAGLLGITLDPAYGGQGLTPEHQEIFDEEARHYTLPPVGELVTTGICAPTLIDFGTEKQRRRHVPPMIRGDEAWTQLLSEPGAGSDLAGLQTRAVLDGDRYVLNGQKVWTSAAQESDYALCIARTNADVPKHGGLSMFIVPLKGVPGVTIRPLRQMTGEAHFNEVFLDDVSIPAENLVGQENDGWRALTAMLTHERLALGAGTGAVATGQSWARTASHSFIDLARARGLDRDPVIREEIVNVYILERTLALLGRKMRDEIAAGMPVGSQGSAAKLATAILARRSSNLGMSLGGATAQAWHPDDPEGDVLAAACVHSPMTAIAGGTSEIQRNTLGERVLGLPREAPVDRDIPFKDVRQNVITKE